MGESIGKTIARLFRNGERFLHKEVSRFNLGYGQFQIIVEMNPGETLQQQQLAQRVHVDKTSIARTILKLESLNYIKRIPSKSDARSYDIELTEKGCEVRLKVIEILKNYTQKMLAEFTTDETENLMRLMDKLMINSKNIVNTTYET
ncbi:MAG: MarR family transcriptional regulator [Deltaproteobacteria bacterium]|nr:MarR family transcriptional regulator [Deltaproteobacteria bacterium]